MIDEETTHNLRSVVAAAADALLSTEIAGQMDADPDGKFAAQVIAAYATRTVQAGKSRG